MKFLPGEKFPLSWESLIWVEAEAVTFHSYRFRFPLPLPHPCFQEQDFVDFWPEPELIRILVFSCSRIIFGSLFKTFTLLVCMGPANTSNSNSKQDFFGSFALRLRSRSGSGSKNFGAGSDQDLKILGFAHHYSFRPFVSDDQVFDMWQ